MANKGFFILTDISGYTEFLTKSELNHAQDAAAGLLNVLNQSEVLGSAD